MRLLTVVLAAVASVAIPAYARAQLPGELRRDLAEAAFGREGGDAQQPVQFERGAKVRTKPPVNQADPTANSLVFIVVAVPGDRLKADSSRVYVNDTAIVGFSPDFVTRVASRPERLPSVVPEGHYFLMGEQRINQDITEHWGQYAGISLIPAR